MSKKVVFILPIFNIATWLHSKTLYRLETMNIAPPPLEWYISYCKILTSDIINRRLAWYQSQAQGYSSDDMVDKICLSLEGNDPIMNAACRIFTSTLGDAEPQLQHFINLHVPNQSWSVWMVNDFFNDIIVEEGEDYRITEYNRIMEERTLLEKRLLEEGKSIDLNR